MWRKVEAGALGRTALAVLLAGAGLIVTGPSHAGEEADALIKVLVRHGVIQEADAETIRKEVAEELAASRAGKGEASPEQVSAAKQALRELASGEGLGFVETMTGGRMKMGVGTRAGARAQDSGWSEGDGWGFRGVQESVRLFTSLTLLPKWTVDFNTELDRLNHESVRVLDAILKYRRSDALNLWIGRHLTPSDRARLDGPYNLATWDNPSLVSRYPSVFAGRDDGIMLWGELNGGRFEYAAGVYAGTSNGNDNLLYAARVAVNLLDPEPGYYTASTYYGDKDILSIGIAVQTQNDAIKGDSTTFGDAYHDRSLFAWNIDALFEKKLAAMGDGVLTLEGAYYSYDLEGAPGDGEGFMALAAWLFPQQVGPGRFQPHARYQEFEGSSIVDAGVNYVIRGHNLRLSLVFSRIDMEDEEAANRITFGAQARF